MTAHRRLRIVEKAQPTEGALGSLLSSYIKHSYAPRLRAGRIPHIPYKQETTLFDVITESPNHFGEPVLAGTAKVRIDGRWIEIPAGLATSPEMTVEEALTHPSKKVREAAACVAGR